MSRTPANTTQLASRQTPSTAQLKSPSNTLASAANTTLPISTGASMPSSQRSGVSFQRTSTPIAIIAISRPISGTNSALKYGGPTDSLAPVMASSTSG